MGHATGALRLTRHQLWTLRRVSANLLPAGLIGPATRRSLRRKGLVTFNAETGKIEITPAGSAYLDAHPESAS